MFSVDRLHFYRHLQVGLSVGRLVDLSECALVDLANNLEVLAHLFQHLRHCQKNYYLKK